MLATAQQIQTPAAAPHPAPRLMDRVRESLRLHRYALSTERTYCHWIKRFIFFHGKRHPAEMGAPIAKIKTAWQLAMERAGLGRFERTLDADGRLIRKEWVGDFTWHGLRHTWASWHVMAGTPLEVLQKLGGWEDLRMVMKYAHLAPEYLAGFAGNAKPWKQGKAVA